MVHSAGWLQATLETELKRTVHEILGPTLADTAAHTSYEIDCHGHSACSIDPPFYRT